MLSYAQNFEDVILWRALRGIGSGCYLDIGAQHPLLDPVSRLFYDAGWRGVHVEPHPHFASQLRVDRPDETVIEAAVTSAPGLIEFFDVDRGGLSTGVASVADIHRAAGFAITTLTVPGITLAAVFDSIGPRDIHWMKIDVEGMEAQVIRGWGDSPARPWVVVIESTFPMSQVPTHEEWIGEVLARGYREVLFDGLNRYFLAEAHPELAKAFAAPANIFDDFSVLPSHPLCRTTVERAEAEQAQLSARLAEQQAEAARATAEIQQQHEAERRTLTERLDQQRDRAQREYDGEQQRLGAEIARIDQQVERAQRAHDLDRARLVAEVERANRHSQRLQEQFDDARQQWDDAFARLRDQAGAALAEAAVRFTEGQASRQSEIDGLQANVTSLSRLVETAKEQLSQSTEIGRALREQMASDQSAIENLGAELNRKNALIEFLVNEQAVVDAAFVVRAGRRLRLLGPAKVQPLEDQSASQQLPVAATPPEPLPRSSSSSSGDYHAGKDRPMATITNVDQLLVLNGRGFIEQAYRLFLKRFPDRGGFEHFLGRLRAGDGKTRSSMPFPRHPRHGRPQRRSREWKHAGRVANSWTDVLRDRRVTRRLSNG